MRRASSARTTWATATSSSRPSTASTSSSATSTTSTPRRSPRTPTTRRSPEFKKKFGPRGVFHCFATDTASTLADDERFGKWGKQKCEDTGPLTKKRMETVDGEVLDKTFQFIDKNQQAGKPWFVWFNTTRMHIFTHLKPESDGKTGLGTYPDGMVEHDGHIGQMLKKLDDLRIADNTIVIWTTDNGAEVMSWPDGGTTPFRGEKNTNWEGGYRVPLVVRWPGVIKPGTEINEVVSHEDWLPTLLAAAGQPNVKESRSRAAARVPTYKVHLDGYNLMPYFKGETKEWPRKEFIYWTDDGAPAGLRYEPVEARLPRAARGRPRRLAGPPGGAALPQAVQRALRIRSSERTATGWTTSDGASIASTCWGPRQGYVARWIQSFKDFPPRQKPGSFNLSQVMEKLTKPQ